MSTREAEKVYSLADAAEVKSVSVDTLRRAIHSTEPAKNLPAKKVGKGYGIKASDLDAWWDRQASA